MKYEINKYYYCISANYSENSEEWHFHNDDCAILITKLKCIGYFVKDSKEYPVFEEDLEYDNSMYYYYIAETLEEAEQYALNTVKKFIKYENIGDNNEKNYSV